MDFELLVEVLGWIGGVEVVIGYTIISLKAVKPDNFYYRFLNLTGAFLLIINTWFHKAYPSAIVNTIWVGIALYTMVKYKDDKNGRVE